MWITNGQIRARLKQENVLEFLLFELVLLFRLSYRPRVEVSPEAAVSIYVLVGIGYVSGYVACNGPCVTELYQTADRTSFNNVAKRRHTQKSPWLCECSNAVSGTSWNMQVYKNACRRMRRMLAELACVGCGNDDGNEIVDRQSVGCGSRVPLKNVVDR